MNEKDFNLLVESIKQAGMLKGKIHMSDDFDAPLDDFKEYMP